MSSANAVEIELTGAKPARQARSRETTRRIVAALEDLLKEKAFEQITMIEIAKGAGITPGAIYRRFENKDALLPHILARYDEELGKWLSRVTPEKTMTSGASLQSVLNTVVVETLKCFRGNAHIFRTVHLHARLNPGMQSDGPRNKDFEPLASILKAFRNEITRPHRDAAAFLGHTLISSCIERTHYPEQLPAVGLQISDRKFARDMANMFEAWLKQDSR
jgi:AcrR family transcriptional regulator